jgi:hypothetical protein
MKKTTGSQIQDFDVSAEDRTFLSGASGIRILPDESFRNFKGRIHQSEAYRLTKWLRQNEPNILVSIEDAPTVNLRSEEYWLPLVFLATDVTLPFYLNLAANYIYDMARGALKHDQTTVHLEAVHQDEKTGKIKRFSYSGPVDGLKACVKKFDISAMMKD